MGRGTIPKKNGEEWRLIDGCSEFYVSNLGRVRKKNRLVKAGLNKYGYPSCWIELSNGERKRATVHRLVANAFIPNPEGKPVVDHISGDKTDNTVTNLRWVTTSENTQAAHDKGLIRRSEILAIDPDDYVFLFKTQTDAAKGAGTDTKTVGQIIQGLTKSAKGWRFFRMKGIVDKR